MRILIVTVEEKCPAEFAVRSDGWTPELRVIDREDLFAYGRILHEFWQDGEPFINIEHDMAPWPGAIQALRSCELEFCLFGYPRAEQGSMGMTRFSRELIRRFPKLSETNHWSRASWNNVENAVLGGLKNVPKHQHFPHVAHLSGWFT